VIASPVVRTAIGMICDLVLANAAIFALYSPI